jgi:hypothetical protein
MGESDLGLDENKFLQLNHILQFQNLSHLICNSWAWYYTVLRA